MCDRIVRDGNLWFDHDGQVYRDGGDGEDDTLIGHIAGSLPWRNVRNDTERGILDALYEEWQDAAGDDVRADANHTYHSNLLRTA